MLGGLDPVLIFQFSKLAPTVGTVLARIPLVSQIPTLVPMPPIPVYLSEQLFNIVIVSEGKSVDIETDTETLTSGATPDVNQKGIQSSIEISIEGKKDSVVLILLSSLIDLVYEKASSKEYQISYMHGAITVFGGVLHSYSVETIEGTDKLGIKFSISKGSKNPTKPDATPAVPGQVGTLPGG